MITSPSTVSVNEGLTTVYKVTASDPDGDPLIYSIAGGPDASAFSIATDGTLSFKRAADFEAPTDIGHKNAYSVQIQVSDGQLTAAQTITVTVLNTREGVQVRRIATGFNKPVAMTANPLNYSEKIIIAQEDGQVYGIGATANGKELWGVIPAVKENWLLLDFVSVNTPMFRGYVSLVNENSRNIGIYQCQLATATSSFIRSVTCMYGVDYFANVLPVDGKIAGSLAFQPDGELFIGLGEPGDGSASSLEAQRATTPLGKILRYQLGPSTSLRIFPDLGGTNRPAFTYFQPDPANPYAGAGASRATSAIFALGLHAPVAIEVSGSNLIIVERGQYLSDEINVSPLQTGGANYAWPYRDGTQIISSGAPAGVSDPALTFTRPNAGAVIVGGVVYTGAIASLSNKYVFVDANGGIWTVPISSLTPGSTTAASQLERRDADFVPDAGKIEHPVAIKMSPNGNLYILDADGELYEVTSDPSTA